VLETKCYVVVDVFLKNIFDNKGIVLIIWILEMGIPPDLFIAFFYYGLSANLGPVGPRTIWPAQMTE